MIQDQITTDKYTLYLGDCLDVLPGVEPGSVDACIVDPPYGIDYQSAWRIDRTQWKPKIANDRQPFVWFLPHVNRVCGDQACLLCFCRWDVQQAFYDAMAWSGWQCKSQVIWDREAHGMGDLNGSPAPQHDVIWFATKGDYHFHAERPKSVVRSPRLGGDELVHPNQKPDDLMQQLVTDYAEPGATVLDCFMGSGTTGVACMRLGRKFIGIEIDPAYFAIAAKRIKQAAESMPLFEPQPQYQQMTLGNF